MKKKYVKPQVYMERFELNQHIAKCDWDYEGSLDANNCRAESNLDGAGNMALFASTTNGCTEIIEAGNLEDYCIFAATTEWGTTYNS